MRPPDEDSLLRHLTRRWTPSNLVTGPGHDCAVLPPIPSNALPVIKTDAVVEGIHFHPQAPPANVGHKALARVLSDFAAAAATPCAALIALGLPSAFNLRRLDQIYRGLEKTAADHRVSLAGGELVRSDVFWIAISGFGHVTKRHHTRRSGAGPGDLLVVTGQLGATQARHHLTFRPRLAEGQWLGAHHFATSMMDLSDGLGRDLPRLARASGLSFVIHPENLPRRQRATLAQAVNDGEDYELLFTVRPQRWTQLIRAWPFDTPITIIGAMRPLNQRADTGGLPFSGFDHLQP